MRFRLFRSFVRFFGFDVVRYKKSTDPLVRSLDLFSISIVLDVGANYGQFAKKLLKNGFKGKVISFEPTSVAYNSLVADSSCINNWVVFDRVALGSKFGEVEINVAGNLAASSSLLAMSDLHLQSAPDSRYVDLESVKLIPLAAVFDNLVFNGAGVLLKIDVQGYEFSVLEGLGEYIDLVKMVKLELSTVSLYDGDFLFDYYFEFFEAKGFELWDLQPGHRDPSNGRLLQFDAVFVKL